MNFQNIIRKGLVIAGFVTVLAVLPVAAQEITNTEFKTGPNVVAIPQPSTLQQSNTASTFALPAPQAIRASQSIAAASNYNQSGVLEMPSLSTDSWIAAAVVLAFALLTLSVVGEVKRINRNASVSTQRA